MYFNFFISLVAITGTVIMSILGILTYRRNKKVENENLIYKFKIEGYFILIEKLTEIVDKILFTKTKIENNENENFKNYIIDEMIIDAQNIDIEVNSLFNLASKYSIVFPKIILEELTALHSFLYTNAVKRNDELSMSEYVLIITEHYSELLTIGDRFHDLIREDLGSEKLNYSLSNRIK